MATKEELKGDSCPKCNGTGVVIAEIFGINCNIKCDQCAGTGVINSPTACPACRGGGTIVIQGEGENFGIEVTCSLCLGKGLNPDL